MKNLTTYERRQMIVRILEEHSGIKVTELAEQLNVSDRTIRTYLSAIEEENKVMRARAGSGLSGSSGERISLTCCGLSVMPRRFARVGGWIGDRQV